MRRRRFGPRTSARYPVPNAVHLRRARQLLVMALWFGAISGLLQLLELAYQKWVSGTFVHRGQHVIWMAPLAESILLVVPAAMLFLLGTRWQRLANPGAAAGTYAFVAAISCLLLPGWFSSWSLLLLAMGIALQVARWVNAHPASFHVLVRRTLAPMVLLIVSVSVGTNVALSREERARLAALPPPRAGYPNVILIIWDTVRARSVSLYNSVLETTPNLDAFAKRGVVFDRAMSAAPWTLPSHASMFTGLFRHQFEAGWAKPLTGDFPTLAETLSAEGYRTGAFVGNLLYTDAEHGLSRGFVTYQDRIASLGAILANSTLIRKVADPVKSGVLGQLIGPHRYLWHKDASAINQDFLAWADQDSARPIFAFLNYFDAHDPYSPPPEFAARLGPIDRPNFVERIGRVLHGKGQWDLSPYEVEQERRAYEASVLYLDHVLGRLLAGLEKRGKLQNSIIIVTSDHGEEFGENGAFAHGEDLYMPALHVPLVIVGKGYVPENHHVDAPVSLRDLPATVLELIGAPSASIPGVSWTRLWEDGDSSARGPTVLSSTASDLYGRDLSFSLTTARYHYIHDFDGSEHFFDLTRDRFGATNVASLRSNSKEFLRMRAFVARLRKCKLPCRRSNSFTASN